MAHLSLDDVFEIKSSALQQLRVIAGKLDSERSIFRPAEGAWTIQEIYEHLALAEAQLLQLIRSLLKKTEESEAYTPPEGWQISIDHIVEKASKEKYQAREQIQPKNGLTYAESLQRLEEIQAQMFELRSRLQAVDPNAISFPHPIFGLLTLGQWLAFIGYHERRHCKQIESIVTLITN